MKKLSRKTLLFSRTGAGCGDASPLKSNKSKTHYEYNRLNCIFLINPEAYLSDLSINISKNYLSFDDAKVYKLGICANLSE